jgi:hypothetical protein
VKQKPLTIAALARLEGLSKGRIRFYIHYIQKAQRKKGVRIQRVGNKLIYTTVGHEEEKFLRQQPAPSARNWEFHFSAKYKDSPYPVRRIEIDGMILIPSRHNVTIGNAIAQVKQIVADRFGGKLAGMLTFSTTPATPESRPYFRFRRFSESTYTELW